MIFPFPSSPHWAPNTLREGMGRRVRDRAGGERREVRPHCAAGGRASVGADDSGPACPAPPGTAEPASGRSPPSASERRERAPKPMRLAVPPAARGPDLHLGTRPPGPAPPWASAAWSAAWPRPVAVPRPPPARRWLAAVHPEGRAPLALGAARTAGHPSGSPAVAPARLPPGGRPSPPVPRRTVCRNDPHRQLVLQGLHRRVAGVRHVRLHRVGAAQTVGPAPAPPPWVS